MRLTSQAPHCANPLTPKMLPSCASQTTTARFEARLQTHDPATRVAGGEMHTSMEEAQGVDRRGVAAEYVGRYNWESV